MQTPLLKITHPYNHKGAFTTPSQPSPENICGNLSWRIRTGCCSICGKHVAFPSPKNSIHMAMGPSAPLSPGKGRCWGSPPRSALLPPEPFPSGGYPTQTSRSPCFQAFSCVRPPCWGRGADSPGPCQERPGRVRLSKRPGMRGAPGSQGAAEAAAARGTQGEPHPLPT